MYKLAEFKRLDSLNSFRTADFGSVVSLLGVFNVKTESAVRWKDASSRGAKLGSAA